MAEGGERSEQIQISEFSGVREDSNLSCGSGAFFERSYVQFHYLQGKGGDGQSDHWGVSHSATGHTGLLGGYKDYTEKSVIIGFKNDST
jgi:hypothetical protein